MEPPADSGSSPPPASPGAVGPRGARRWLRLVLGSRAAAVVGLLIVLASGILAHRLEWRPADKMKGEDIYYTWLEGHRLDEGENPYERVLEGDMRRNRKYATYFPLSYLLSALPQVAGEDDFSDWLAAWQVLALVCMLATAVVLFRALETTSPALAVAVAAFWLLNRWTLNLSAHAYVEPLPIFLLVLGVAQLPRNPRQGYLFYGLSLAIKQVAIFLLPVFLAHAWLQGGRPNNRRGLAALLTTVGPSLAVALPFLLWNPKGFLKSVAFSATRNSSSDFGLYSFDVLLQKRLWEGLVGFPARLPMLILMVLVAVAILRRRIGVAWGSFLVMVIFADFNPVFFEQYLSWFVPLLPLALRESHGAAAPGLALPPPVA